MSVTMREVQLHVPRHLSHHFFTSLPIGFQPFFLKCQGCTSDFELVEIVINKKKAILPTSTSTPTTGNQTDKLYAFSPPVSTYSPTILSSNIPLFVSVKGRCDSMCLSYAPLLGK